MTLVKRQVEALTTRTRGPRIAPVRRAVGWTASGTAQESCINVVVGVPQTADSRRSPGRTGHVWFIAS
jgi:hypothetical protein